MDKKLVNVEAGRAIAALLVVFYHADKYYFDSPKYWSAPFLNGLFAFGHAGVEFFFVLSGFIIAMIHWQDIRQPQRLRSFVTKRFARIYPFYWLCLAAAVMAFFMVPSFGTETNRNLTNIAGSFTLFGIEPTRSVLFVSWTLFYEIVFYAVFGLMILVGTLPFILWMALCLSNVALGLTDHYVLSFMNLLFAMGVGCALFLKNGQVKAPIPVALAGALIFLAFGLEDAFVTSFQPFVRTMGYGLGATLVLLGIVEIERSQNLKAPDWLVLCGSASYAIYLTHMFSLAITAKVLRAIGMTEVMHPAIAFALLSCSAAGAGVLIHSYVEKPVISRARQWIDRAGRATRPA